MNKQAITSDENSIPYRVLSISPIRYHLEQKQSTQS